MGRESLHSADAGAPESLVDGVSGLFPEKIESVLLQIINLLLPTQAQFPYRGDDLNFGRQDLEYYIKSYLVVACSGTSVRYRIGTYLLTCLSTSSA